MRFDTCSKVEDIVWRMRLADQTRAADRAVILKQFNGNPPFDDDEVEDNNIQINVNDLSGPNLLSMARRQWNNAFLKPSNYFSAKPEAFQDIVESVSPGPYLELFARRKRLGWSVWGNEVDSDVAITVV